MNKSFLTVSLVALAGLLGCNRPAAPQSSTQSLDNLVSNLDGSGQTDNKCGVSYTTVAALKPHVQLFVKDKRVRGAKKWRDEVKGTLDAAPLELLRPFAAAGGIVVVKDTVAAAERACEKAPLSPSERSVSGGKIQACWTANPTRIILPPVKERIRSDLIRELSYFFTEYFVDRGASAKGLDGLEPQAFFTGFAETRAKLKTAFLADIKSNEAAYKKLTTVYSDKKQGDIVYAEAIDSYYCSADSKAKFRDNFKASWDVFTDSDAEYAPVQVFGH
jgi:hypothetical protein